MFKMTSIIPPSACMMNERDKKNCTIRVREGTPRCLVNHPSRPSVSLKYFHKMCVCVCVCVFVCVYVVYENTRLYNDMGMT